MAPLEQAEEKIKKYGGIWSEEGWVVEGNLNLWNLSLAALPKIKSVGGNFLCGYNQLINLAGSPRTVGGDFDCWDNQLINLIGAPKMVGKDFYCHYNPLKSLVGLPDKIGGEFICDAGLSFPKEEIILLVKAHPKNLALAIKRIKWL